MMRDKEAQYHYHADHKHASLIAHRRTNDTSQTQIQWTQRLEPSNGAMYCVSRSLAVHILMLKRGVS